MLMELNLESGRMVLYLIFYPDTNVEDGLAVIQTMDILIQFRQLFI
jgi:hypothetical protein